jgi:hypothetical protein
MKYDSFYGIDTRESDGVRAPGWSGSGIHVFCDDAVEVVIGSNSKYGEPSRSYVSVELKARGIKVTAGDEACAEVEALRRPASPEVRTNRDQYRYGHIDWRGLAIGWLARWVASDPARLAILLDVTGERGELIGACKKREEWADWFRDGLQKSGISSGESWK